MKELNKKLQKIIENYINYRAHRRNRVKRMPRSISPFQVALY
jgi:hypothetical protein